MRTETSDPLSETVTPRFRYHTTLAMNSRAAQATAMMAYGRRASRRRGLRPLVRRPNPCE